MSRKRIQHYGLAVTMTNPTSEPDDVSQGNTISTTEVLNAVDLSDLSQNQIASFQERIKSVGLWNPIHLHSDHTVVRDGQDEHIVAALQALGVEKLEIIHRTDSHSLAVPSEEYSINDVLARKAAKLGKGGQAAKADYIVSYIQQRVCRLLPESQSAPHRDDGNVPVKILNILDNVNREDRNQEWPYGPEIKEELETLLNTVNLSPSRAREYAQAYIDGHEDDLAAFHEGEISLKMLNVRRQIRDSEIADHYKKSLIDLSEKGAFNAPQLSKLLSVAQTGYTKLLDEVFTGNASPSKAKMLAQRAEERELSGREMQTALRKIRAGEGDADEYISSKLPDDIEAQFREIIAGDWLDENEQEYYKKQLTRALDNDEDVDKLLNQFRDHKRDRLSKPDLPDEISKEEFQNELRTVLTHEQDQRVRQTLQESDDPRATFEQKKQAFEDKLTKEKSKDERLDERLTQLIDSPDAVWEQSLANRNHSIHKAVPLVNSNVQVFFHKAQPTTDHDGMGEEIEDDSVDFFFFSPPYYSQRGMISSFLDQLDSVDDAFTEELTEAQLDAGFKAYVDTMMDVFQAVYRKLKPHRYFLLNTSDHQVKTNDQTPNKRYPISEALVSRIHTDLNRSLAEDELKLEYVGRLSWYKTFSGVKRASLFFENQKTKGLPLYYYPEDRIEDIYIFRKGPSNPEKVYKNAIERFDREFSSLDEFKHLMRYEEPKVLFENAFGKRVQLEKFSDMFKTDLWIIPPATGNSHPAGFPTELAKLVTQLYSLPGDRIVDPMVGFGTTLEAVQQLNTNSPFEVKRQGLGWEDFSGEQQGQPDYLEMLIRRLSTFDDDPYGRYQ